MRKGVILYKYMKKNSNIYISIYKQDYIWNKINTKIKIKQQNKSCKKLSIPKYVREKYKIFKKFFI
jgi:uncharacterized pyridoxamine 5'-phosphate oxidase family protein